MKQGFRHIRAFLQTAHLGSFTRAAQTLHVSQPALSVQIRQLEEELGVQLFSRDRRTVTITEAGRNMIAPLQRILNEFDDAVQTGHDIAGLTRGRLTIAALPSIAAAWLPQQIKNFHGLYPNIELRVADVPADTISQLLRNEEADLALGPWISRDRALSFRELWVDQLHVFFPPGHPLATVKKPTLRTLARYPHIVTRPGTSVRQVLHHALEQAGLDIEIVCEAAYLSTAISMVRAGLGITVLPLSTLSAAPCGGLFYRPVANKYLGRRLGLLALTRTVASPAAVAFTDLLLSQRDRRQG